MKFLIVDDSHLARVRLCKYIEKLGFEVIGEAIDGYDAIEKFKKLSPDAIAIDLEMPKMKGIEASKKILEINPNVDIILVTSIVDKKEIINAFKVGIKKVIRKPFTIELLEQTINELKG
jgi:two-component system chemotaxis response regulator CheY